MLKEETLPQLLWRNRGRYGQDKVAMRKKDFGFWKEYTWEDYYEAVRYFCLGLVDLGLKPEDKVAIGGDNAPEWYWAELAALSAGAQVVGFFTDAVPGEVKYILEDSGVSFVVAHDQEQVDKILKIIGESTVLKEAIKNVIYWDPKGLGAYQESMLMSFKRVLDLGKKYEEAAPGHFEELVERGEGKDIALLLYTSGTKALPKGALISHGNIISSATYNVETLGLQESYNALSYVSPAWIAEQLTISGQLVLGMSVNFGEKPETQQHDIREIGPDYVFYSSRLWESVVSMIQVKVGDAGFIKRFVYHLFVAVGYKKADLYFAREKLNLFWKVLYGVAYLLVFRPLTDKFGLSKAKACMTGGASLSPQAFRFLNGMGLNLLQNYGLTEASPLTSHMPGEIKFESIGRPVKDVEVRLSDEGEILGRSGSVFRGYHRNAEAYAKTVRDGWLCTGDAGHMDEDGHVILYDRMSDMTELASGDRFAPQYIEGRLRFSPYVRDVMVVGRDKDCVTAVMNIDFDVVGKWAERNHIPYTTFTDLSQKEEVYELIDKELNSVNRTLPQPVRVKRYFNLHKEFDPDEAELTRTRKLRRSFMEEKYGDTIDAMYRGENRFFIESAVTYTDGRKGKTSTEVKIRYLETEAGK